MVPMSFLANLKQRCRRPEVMDQPGLDDHQHQAALRGLERINFWSGSTRILWPPLRTLLREARQPLRVLDIASGAGDLPINLWRKANRAGFRLEAEAWDLNPLAVAYARRRAGQRKADARVLEADALSAPVCPDYDVILSSLFLHHLDEDQAVTLLRRMARAAKRMVLVNDLVRSRAGFVLAYLGTRLLSTSAVVH